MDETTTPLTTEPSSPSTTTGTVEEIKTETPTVVTPKRNFPSFPIRGGGDSLSFKPKLDFSRKTKSSFKFGRQPAEAQDHDGDEKEENVTEQSDIASTEQSTTTTSKPETSSKRFFVDLTGGKVPRVKSNLLFNKRKRPNKERFRLKLEKLQQKAATESSSSTSPSTSTAESVTEVQTPASQFKLKSKKKPLTFFRKVPDVSFTNALLKLKSRNKGLLFKNKKKFDVETVPEEKQEEDVTEDANAIATTFAPAAPALSVESELEEDIDESQDANVNVGGKWPSVRKANKAPANGNIRVEFKKKVDGDANGLRGKFFINPDGRKPRVKSNIRAKFANRGQHFGPSTTPTTDVSDSKEEETFDGASSQLDLTPFNKNIDDKEALEEDVNTEKREVNNAEAPAALAVLNQISNETPEKTVSQPPSSQPPQFSQPPASQPPQFSHELPLFPLTPLTLNPRQSQRDRRPPSPSEVSTKPPLPASILKHISHITDIRSLPPLPPLFSRKANKKLQKVHKKEETTTTAEEIITQSPNSSNSLLEQLVVNDSSLSSSVFNNPEPSFSSSSSSQPFRPSPSVPSIVGGNKLSAFRALQQQIEKREGQISSSQENLV